MGCGRPRAWRAGCARERAGGGGAVAAATSRRRARPERVRRVARGVAAGERRMAGARAGFGTPWGTHNALQVAGDCGAQGAALAWRRATGGRWRRDSQWRVGWAAGASAAMAAPVEASAFGVGPSAPMGPPSGPPAPAPAASSRSLVGSVGALPAASLGTAGALHSFEG